MRYDLFLLLNIRLPVRLAAICGEDFEKEILRKR